MQPRTNELPLRLKCLIIAVPIAVLLKSDRDLQIDVAEFAVFTALAWFACAVLGKVVAGLRKPRNPEYLDMAATDIAVIDLPEERACPYCCERIKAAATICRYCHSPLGKAVSKVGRSKVLVGSLSALLVLSFFHASSAISDVDARIEEVSENVEEAKRDADHAIAQSEVDDVKSEVESSKSDLDLLQADVNVVKADVDSVRAEIDILRSEIAMSRD